MRHKVLAIKLTIIGNLLSWNLINAQNTGFQNPTDTTAPKGWTNPTYAFISDNSWATVAHGPGCNCPFVYLSWNKGVTYTKSKLFGPFDTIDSWQTIGGDTAKWGHSWVDTELNNNNFRLKITNPGLTISQGYSDFNLSLPPNVTIDGIAVKMQAHGDSAFTIFYLNNIEVNVFYTLPLGEGVARASINNISVYPNPAHEKITLQVNGYSAFSYSLFSVDGRRIIANEMIYPGNDFTYTIPLNTISPGIYILRIINDAGVNYSKVVIQ
jgi:hypothetical protein